MGQTTFYSQRYQGWPPVAVREIGDPNSRHWEQQAQAAQRRLSEALGDDYPTWAEMTWPGESIDNETWAQIHASVQWALDHPEAISQQLECTCNPAGIGAPCPVCQANARIRERGA